MRVAVVTAYPPSTASLNEYAFHFVRTLREKPEIDEIILLTDQPPAGMTAEPAEKTRVVPCWSFGSNMNPRNILVEIKRAAPDAVLFNIQFSSFGAGKIPATLGLLAPSLVRRAGFPTIVLLHNIMETVDLKGAGFAASGAADKLIRAVGARVMRSLLSVDIVAVTIPKYVEILERKYDAKNVVLAPHGAFEERAMPSFDLPPGPLQIMTFGKFGTYKKVDILIEAFKSLTSRRSDPLELVIGGGDSPNAKGYIATVEERHAGVEGIRYTGYVAEEDVPKLFRDAAIVVFPYTSTTGSSGVLHQAGDFGKAVVLPDLGDLSELVEEEGYIGEFFEPNDVDSLAAAIERLLDDPEHRSAIGRQNYLASHGLLMNDVVDWYLLHFELLVRERAAHAKMIDSRRRTRKEA